MLPRKNPTRRSNQNFREAIAADPCIHEPLSAHCLVYPTEADYREIRPDLRHISHESYLNEFAKKVAEAHQAGLPVVVKAIRARTFRDWLTHHGLEQSPSNIMLYGAFAPLLEDDVLLSKLGVGDRAQTGLYKPGETALVPNPQWAEIVEKEVVRIAVAHRFSQFVSVLAVVYALRRFSPHPEATVAIAALADRLATGIPYRTVNTSMLEGTELAAAWVEFQRGDQIGLN